MESFYSGVRHASEEDLEMKNLDDYAAERLIKSTWEKKGGNQSDWSWGKKKTLWIMNWKRGKKEA